MSHHKWKSSGECKTTKINYRQRSMSENVVELDGVKEKSIVYCRFPLFMLLFTLCSVEVCASIEGIDHPTTPTHIVVFLVKVVRESGHHWEQGRGLSQLLGDRGRRWWKLQSIPVTRLFNLHQYILYNMYSSPILIIFLYRIEKYSETKTHIFLGKCLLDIHFTLPLENVGWFSNSTTVCDGFDDPSGCSQFQSRNSVIRPPQLEQKCYVQFFL